MCDNHFAPLAGAKLVLLDEKRANAFLQTYSYLASVGEEIRSLNNSISGFAEKATQGKRRTPDSRRSSPKKRHSKCPEVFPIAEIVYAAHKSKRFRSTIFRIAAV